jgi:hypothetical protein
MRPGHTRLNAVPRHPKEERRALFLLLCANWQVIADRVSSRSLQVSCKCIKCMSHTSMPHWRTWSAFFLASGHSSAVPSALFVDIRQVITGYFGHGKHIQKTHCIKAVKLAATSGTTPGHKYGVRSGQVQSDRKPKSNTKNPGADQAYIPRACSKSTSAWFFAIRRRQIA